MRTEMQYSAIPFCLVAAIGWAPVAGAVQFTLSDSSGRSSVQIESTTGSVETWLFSGFNHLADLGVRFRTSDTGDEQSLSDLTFVGSSIGASSAILNYEDPGAFTFDVSYALSSPFPTRSILTEQIRIENTSSDALDLAFVQDALDFSLFQYADFDLTGTAGNDTVTRVSVDRVSQENTITTLDGFIDRASVLDASQLPPTEIGIPNITELAIFPSLAERLGFLGADTDGPTTLTDSVIGSSLTGDATWAWQWDFTLDPGESQTLYLSNLRYVMDVAVPAPTTISLLALGLLSIGFSGRRQLRDATSKMIC